MSAPKISVIVPIYNVEKYLRQCLDSILSQTFRDFEAILVNDCSPDNSAAVCREYAAKDDRIKIIRNKENMGSSLSRKIGFENSVGEYIINVDSDDWVEPEYLSCPYDAAVKENADLTCCDFYKDFPDRRELVEHIVDTDNRFNNLGWTKYKALWSYLFKRDLYEKIEFPLHSMAEDMVMTQQALFHSKKLCKVARPLYHYRSNPDSMMQNMTAKRCLEEKENILWTVDFLKNNLQDDFAAIEHNVKICVNRFKYSVIKNKNVRKNKELRDFYPNSGLIMFIIRNKWLKKMF